MVQIGGTRPSAEPLSGSRANPMNLGVGVGNALQGLANSGLAFGASVQGVQDAEEDLALAHLERERETDRFNTLTSLSNLEESWRQQLVAASNDVEPSARDFTNNTRIALEVSQREWLQTVPKHLQEEMQFRSKSVLDGLTTQAYTFEVGQRNDYFRQTLTTSVEQARNTVFEAPEVLERQEALVAEKIASTSLPLAEKEALLLDSRRVLQAAAAGKLAELAALNRGTIGPADGSDIVAAGLPAIARGVLNAIASTEAPGYNVLNGGATFEGYESHPASRGIKGKDSTAAGRYQITIGTWKDYAPLAGVTDFSPESQDRVAWVIAQDRYKKAHGRDLYNDLMSGDRDAVKAVRSILSGEADPDNLTWKGLQSMTDDEWANRVLGGRGAGRGPSTASQPDLFNDPRFQHLTLDQRLALVEDGERRADEIRTAQLRSEKAAYDSNLQDLYRGIQLGEVRRADIEQLLEADRFQEITHYEKAVALYENRNKDMADLTAGVSMLNNGAVWSPTDTDHKKRLNAVAGLDQGLQLLEKGDQPYVTDRLVPLVAQTQMIPTDVLGRLEGMTRGPDGQRMAYAFETLRQLEEASPVAFQDQVNDDFHKDYVTWQGLRDTYPVEEVIQRMRRVREFRADYPELREEADKYLKDEVDGDKLAKEISDFYLTPDQPIQPYARASLMREFSALFRDAYTMSADKETAEKIAVEQMRKTWGATSHGGGWSLMKFPPERSGYRPVAESFDWIDSQLKSEFPTLEEADRFQLVPDGQTRIERDDFAHGKRETLPSYLVFQEREGVISAVIGEGNQPVRWRGDHKAAQDAEISDTTDYHKRLRYIRLQEKGPTRSEAEETEFQNLVNELAN